MIPDYTARIQFKGADTSPGPTEYIPMTTEADKLREWAACVHLDSQLLTAEALWGYIGCTGRHRGDIEKLQRGIEEILDRELQEAERLHREADARALRELEVGIERRPRDEMEKATQQGYIEGIQMRRREIQKKCRRGTDKLFPSYSQGGREI